MYKNLLREVGLKPKDAQKFKTVIREEFKRNAVQVSRMNVTKIEFLIRKGKKQLEMIQDPNTILASTYLSQNKP